MRRDTLALVFDPVCIGACALYTINRWLISPHVSAAWVHSWVDDAFLIPAALPLLLTFQRMLGLRNHDGPPTWIEIAAHLAGWSLLFEYIGPMLNRHSTGDILDVAAYSMGAAVAGIWWHKRRTQASPHPGEFRRVQSAPSLSRADAS